MSVGPLRYLSDEAVAACLPPVDLRIDLAQRALTALASGGAEMPPKMGVHPRPGALLHAMPAWLRDGDVVGLKWVSAFPNNRQRGLPSISGLVVLNDPETGMPSWILDAARITAVRTAAVSGVAIRRFRPTNVERVAMIGAIQAQSHLEVVAALLPDTEVVIYDRHAERSVAMAEAATRDQGLRATTAADPRIAVASAQVVLTMATLLPAGEPGQVMTPDWVSAGTLIVSVDFATYASAALARAARAFVTDDVVQFLAYRDGGYFDGFPDPGSSLGDAMPADGNEPSSDSRPVLVNHLGVGLADVVLADAIAGRAAETGAGVELAR